MARPLMNPQARFASEKAIWDTALANEGAVWHAESTNDAIRITMRLNIYRKTLRNNAPDGLVYEDHYIVARRDNVITIKRRPPIRGFGTKLDGRPLVSPEEAQQRIIAGIASGDFEPDEPLGLDIADD